MNTEKRNKRKRNLQRAWPRRAPRASRRGVLLLVILSMLIIFLMTAVAFVVVTRHYFARSKAGTTVDNLVEPSQNLLDLAFYDLLRDSLNPFSRVRYHSLLRDMYGEDGFAVQNEILVNGQPQFQAELAGAAVVPGTGATAAEGQFIDLGVQFDPSLLPLSKIENYYNGHVLTMVDGPAAGLSTRIVGYARQDQRANRSTAMFRVLAFERDSRDAGPLLPQPRDRFIVNGRPFNGTGIGYDIAGTGYLDLKNADGQEYALLPNFVFSDPGDNPQWFQAVPGQGGSDEGYDVPDYQNMLMAYVPMNPTIPSTPPGQPLDPNEIDRIPLPSLHSRALINYWIRGRLQQTDESQWNPLPQQVLADPRRHLAAARDARRVILRPLVADHPKFPRLASLINGPWDVDNDGDGVPDSVWVDFGYPAVQMSDGRSYKPMFAVLVQDLDGRLNLNAHGSREDYFAAVDGRPAAESGAVLASVDPTTPRTAANRPAGQGYGPAEISLWPLFEIGGTPQPNDYLRLLNGGDVVGLRDQPGRNGVDQWPGAPANRWDLLAQMKFHNVPLVYQPPTHFVGAAYSAWANEGDAYNALARRDYATPPDLKGRFGLGVDFHGFPNYVAFDESLRRQGGGTMAAESPYEKNLLEDGPRTSLASRTSDGQVLVGDDALFSEAELERLLRIHDADVGHLPDRLLRLASIFDGTKLPPGEMGENIRSVTTRSFDLPVPSVVAPHELQQATRAAGGRVTNVVDLLLLRLRRSSMNPNGINLSRTSDDELKQIVRELLSQDLLDNLRLDLNRPFGDSIDNDGDGAVDDPDEAARGLDTLLGPLRGIGADPLTVNTAAANSNLRAYQPVQGLDAARERSVGAGNSPQQRAFAQANARQLMARHLFVLMMMLKDPSYTFPFVDPSIQGNPALEKRLTTLRLAQWSVNAVDFRDPDSIMTGFEVDLEPFVDNDGNSANGTWDVDGNLGGNSPDNGQPWRAVVWGMERPDLLITETLATHDLRVRDSTYDTGGNDRRDEDDPNQRDEDLDQFRIPQGSLFVELYCTGNPTNAVMPGELFTHANRQWLLDLGRQPTDPNTGERDVNPVWRLAITERHDDADSVRRQFRQRPETTTFQPERMDLIDGTRRATIDRYVWFTLRPPTGARVPDRERIFWNTNVGGAAVVPAGQYAVVGPRPVTYFGSQLDNMGERAPAVQQISLATGRIPTQGTASLPYQFDALRTGERDVDVKAAYGIIAGMSTMPVGWNRRAQIGLNISEPLPDVDGPYYPEPTVQLDGYPEVDAYGDVGKAERMLDQPEDTKPNLNRPVAELPQQIGTNENVRTIFLQRLADPTTPWNPPPDDPRYAAYYVDTLPVNPYITVDWQPVDLTVFNGEDTTPIDWNGDDGNFIHQDFSGDQDNIRFSTRERGLPEQGQTIADNIWRAESRDQVRPSNGGGPQGAFFRERLNHTLGYLNESYGRPLAIPDKFRSIPVPNEPSINARTLALGAPGIPDPNNPNARFATTPRPFPWLTWNDRPYVSQYELLQVPISAPGRLTVEHSVAPAQGAGFHVYDPQRVVQNVYQPLGAAPTFLPRYTNPSATFGHLLNFFATTAQGTTFPGGAAGPDFYRLLEYTGVPSRFVGTETFLNPLVFSRRQFPGTELRRPPFNRISMYRDPGKVNLNTIFSEKVYRGLFHGNPSQAGAGRTVHPGPSWPEFIASRRGYNPTDGNNDAMFALNDRVPTFFAGHFGPPDAGHLVPLTANPTGEPDMRRAGVEMGILRNSVGRVARATGDPRFDDNSANRNDPEKDVDRNPYFRYQPMQRLANLTTTRSNVFAVWITVGFFEMEPVPTKHRGAVLAQPNGQDLFNRLYPEGKWLTRELGSDTGQTKRYRGFYMFDRSIPVAFEPGQNHNVDRAVLVRRRIE